MERQGGDAITKIRKSKKKDRGWICADIRGIFVHVKYYIKEEQ
jgi:hypothetical protein